MPTLSELEKILKKKKKETGRNNVLREKVAT